MDDEILERMIHSLAVAVYLQAITDYIMLSMHCASSFCIDITSESDIGLKKREIVKYLQECGSAVPGFGASSIIKYMDENKEILYQKITSGKRGRKTKIPEQGNEKGEIQDWMKSPAKRYYEKNKEEIAKKRHERYSKMKAERKNSL